MYGARTSFKRARSFSSLGRESNSSLLDQIAIAMTYTFIHKRWQIEEGVSGEVTVQSMYLGTWTHLTRMIGLPYLYPPQMTQTDMRGSQAECDLYYDIAVRVMDCRIS